ncbi:dihydrofolate reductase family protein [Ruminococcus sp. Marseille-P6503]|uniref:dihydrofolate reductase family protein n=1 Tax=Ruminococcus sp. Marseille-P6503 TaxID=2364796 RepID=UPI000F53E1D4|nr:dihydrofolate reductase family protein [Ruminococcus sp. Marseille-P6503]
MRKTVLYIAMSLDGFIADKQGGVSWLDAQSAGNAGENSFSEFQKTVDTVIMGYATYKQIITELSPNEWPYKGMQTYVLTHKSISDKAEINFTKENIQKLLQKLKKQNGGDIWICGGADTVNQFICKNMIDIYRITIAPCILGNGLRLFNNENRILRLKLISTVKYGGMIELIYEHMNFIAEKGELQ